MRSISATASASPRPSIMVVEVVGASPIGQASGARGSSSFTSAAWIRVESGLAPMAIMGMRWRLA